jgi:hypothetical protein
MVIKTDHKQKEANNWRRYCKNEDARDSRKEKRADLAEARRAAYAALCTAPTFRVWADTHQAWLEDKELAPYIAAKKQASREVSAIEMARRLLRKEEQARVDDCVEGFLLYGSY